MTVVIRALDFIEKWNNYSRKIKNRFEIFFL